MPEFTRDPVRWGFLGAGGMEIVREIAADPAFDRPEKVAPGKAHEFTHRFFDAGRVAARGQIIGDLLVARPLAFEKDSVEVENKRAETDRSGRSTGFDALVELHAFRSPNKAVPTRTWVAPQTIAVSKSADIPIDRPSRPCLAVT